MSEGGAGGDASSGRFAGREVDVCIVGSGAGGGTMAFSLARGGLSVVVLEKGPYYHEKDFTHDEVVTCRRDFFIPDPAKDPHILTHGPTRNRRSNEGWTACCVGGGTVHMSGFFYRLHPEDFRMRTRYGTSLGDAVADWPIEYKDLAPYYDMVENEVGVSGQAGEYPFEPPRSGPYPMPPLAANPLAGLVDKGAKALGLHPFQTPRAIISEARNGRSACNYCQFCGSYGCEVGAKSSSMAALLPRALGTNNLEIRPHSMAFEVVVDAQGKASGVRYFDESGAVQEQKARLVCVSATSVESARLLLASKSSRFPDGLLNDHGLVGKNLTFSTLGKVWGEFDRAAIPAEFKSESTIQFLQRSIQDDYILDERKGGYDKGGTLNFLIPHKNPIFTADHVAHRHKPPLWGAALQKALHRHFHEIQELECEVFGEFLPTAGTFVSLDASMKDPHDLPVAHIHVEGHAEDRVNCERLVARARAVFDAAGAAKTGTDVVGGTTFVLQHGTCRFGKDPKTSVLDPFCRAHAVPNLYVVDGSFMPSSGGVPTTMTIMANAFRVAERNLLTRRRG
jgi:choline dehydrogenase-like flavoprotein